ncbi:MAG: ATP-binding protein [Actinobacteria bacterium]|nr:ATP-binding protein [Actinomycetota bacterium]
MITKEFFYQLNPWWENKKIDLGIKRELYLERINQHLDNKYILLITGIRRVGKTTLIRQIIDKLINKGISPKQILYFLLDSPKVAGYTLEQIINEYLTIHDFSINDKVYVFFDEIQFFDNWEQQIKELYDLRNMKFVISGSSSLLLSKNLHFLTGRNIKFDIHPLTYKEFLKFKDINISVAESFKNSSYVEEYMEFGGMPEYVLNPDSEYIQTTIDNILFRDIVGLHGLRNPNILRNLILLLADRVGSVTSSLKISNILNINKDTTLRYLEHLENVFIVNSLKRFSTSRNKQIYSPEKFYFSDTGVLSVYASKINLGASAENTLFNYLHRHIEDELRISFGYYYENRVEIDFTVLKDNKKILIESKYKDKVEMEKEDLKEIKELISSEKIHKVFIVSKNYENRLIHSEIEINIVPIWKVLLSDDFIFLK